LTGKPNGDVAVIEQTPLQDGRNMTMMLGPSKSVISGEAEGSKPPADDAKPSHGDGEPSQDDGKPPDDDAKAPEAETPEAEPADGGRHQNGADAQSPTPSDATA
jgi:translation initiation factor IF-3